MKSSVRELVSTWWMQSSTFGPQPNTILPCNDTPVDLNTEKDAIEYLSVSILSLAVEIKKCSSINSISFEEQVKVSLQSLLEPWDLFLNPKIPISNLVEEVLNILSFDKNTCPLLVVPNFSCIHFDQHPIDLSSVESMPIPMPSEVFPPNS